MSFGGSNNRYILIVVAVFGGTALLASLIWITLWLTPSSGEIIRVATWRLLNAQSFHVAADLQYHGTGRGGLLNDVQWTSDGDFDRRSTGTLSAHDFTLQFGSGESPLTFGGRLAGQAKFNLLTLKQVPERFGSLNLQQFQDRTLRVDTQGVLDSLPNLPFVGGLRLTDADRQQIMTTAAGLPFLTVEEKLPNDTVRGVATYHYRVKSEMIYVREFLKLIEAKRLGRDLTVKELGEYDASFADYTAEDGELWLGTSDYYVQRLRLYLRHNGSASGLWTLTLDFSRYNEATGLAMSDLTGVEDATPYIDSLLAAYTSHLPMAKAGSAQLGAATGGSLPVDSTTAASIDADDDGLPFILEIFYGTDLLNPDSDGDGVRDGAEVDETRSPMGPWGLFDFTQGQFR